MNEPMMMLRQGRAPRRLFATAGEDRLGQKAAAPGAAARLQGPRPAPVPGWFDLLRGRPPARS